MRQYKDTPSYITHFIKNYIYNSMNTTTLKRPQTLQMFYKAMTPQQREEISKLLQDNRKQPFYAKYTI